jgi:mannosyl-3-phosphoglycerate phosphatase family protein
MAKVVVFTDLDGTLLDEDTYSAELSLAALRDLQRAGVPVVFCSSKTRQEQEFIRSELGVQDPFIVENGSAIVMPPGSVPVSREHAAEPDGTRIVILGMPLPELRTILAQVVAASGVAYQSFFDLSPEQVVELTGLDLEAAGRAKAREFSETIVTQFSPAELEIFERECRRRGLQCAQGGRFLSVTRVGATKGAAVQFVAQCYRAQFGDLITVAIGDSPNDAPMLRAVDVPFLVQRPNGQWRRLEIPNLRLLSAIGPQGFAEMAKMIVAGRFG